MVGGTTYYYVVSAVNALGESDDLGVAVGTPPCFAPAAPTGLAAGGSKGRIDPTWDVVSDALNYSVNRSLANGGPYDALVTNLMTTHYTDTNVISGQVYFYTVSANGACATGNPSAEVSAPLLLERPIVTPDGIVLQAWGGVSGQQYFALSSTNLTDLPSSWTRFTTNVFEPSGFFKFTNNGVPSASQQFFRIQTTNR